jgi:hypothetical protein
MTGILERWNIGIMGLEKWNDGERRMIVGGITPMFQDSILPLFHVLGEKYGGEEGR